MVSFCANKIDHLFGEYFEHLQAEIFEIRLSKRRFYQKLTDIYATAIDYNRDLPTTKLFFNKVQNKRLMPRNLLKPS